MSKFYMKESGQLNISTDYYVPGIPSEESRLSPLDRAEGGKGGSSLPSLFTGLIILIDVISRSFFFDKSGPNVCLRNFSIAFPLASFTLSPSAVNSYGESSLFFVGQY